MSEQSLQNRLAANFRKELVKELKQKQSPYRAQVFASAPTHLVADLDNFGKNVRILKVAINAAQKIGEDATLHSILDCVERTCQIFKAPIRAQREVEALKGIPGELRHEEDRTFSFRGGLAESQIAVHREMAAKRERYEKCLAVIDPIRLELRRILMQDRGAEK